MLPREALAVPDETRPDQTTTLARQQRGQRSSQMMGFALYSHPLTARHGVEPHPMRHADALSPHPNLQHPGDVLLL